MDSIKHRNESQQVIWMGVGEHGHVDRVSTSSTKHRHDRQPSRVYGTASESSSVDEHRSTIRQIDQHSVALSHIDERHPKPAGWSAGHSHRPLYG